LFEDVQTVTQLLQRFTKDFFGTGPAAKSVRMKSAPLASVTAAHFLNEMRKQ
tara:strand:+ start:6943 stop:7098 length:156 start_codon:yes stop_codon:yes gene_type:complete